MRSIAIINQKGGVGKTTTTVHVAAALAEEGAHVLLLDLDPQSHATLHLGIELDPETPSIYDVIVNGAPLAGIAHAAADRLVVLPARVDLAAAEVELAAREQRETVLARVLQPYQEGFDFCFLDCAPSLGLLTVNALVAVEEVIIPLQPHFLALQGLGRLLETIALVRQSLNPNLRVSGVVLCMYERGTRLAQEVQDDVTRFIAEAQPDEPWYGARVFKTVIRRNIKLAECPSFGQTVFQYAASSNGAEDYRALSHEIRANNGRPTPTSAAKEQVLTTASQPADEVVAPSAAAQSDPVALNAEQAAEANETPAAAAEMEDAASS